MPESRITLKTTFNTAGLYYLLDDADPIDNVYSFLDQDGRKIKNVNNKGPYIAREGGILPGSNMLTRLQAIFNTSAVKEVIFEYGDITITGTLDCNGKKIIFKNDARIIGINTLSNGVLDCDLQAQCFSINTTLTNFSSVKIKFSTENFGALGNATDETVIYQKTSDTLISNPGMPRVIKMFPNKIYVSHGWVWHNWNGSDYAQYTLSLEGEPSAFASPVNFPPRLRCNNLEGFALNVQRATGGTISGIAFENPSISIASAADITEYRNRSYANFMSGTGARDSRYSPNCLLCIDAFRNTNTIPNDGGYPDFNGTVTVFNPSGINWNRGLIGSANAGSTGINVEDCSFAGATVCVMVSPNGQSQQAENLTFKNIYPSICKAAFGWGQSESKNCYIYSGYCIDRVHTVIDGASWGLGNPTLPHVKGFNTAGSIVRCIYGGNGQHPVEIANWYAENLYEIGQSSGNAGTLEFNNCSFSFSTETQNGGLVMPAQHYIGDNTVFSGCTMRYYDDAFNKRIVIQGRANILRGCYLDAPPISTTGQDHPGTSREVNLTVEYCRYGAGNSQLFGFPTLKGQVDSRQDGSIAVGHITLENQNEENYGRVLYEWNCGGYDKTELHLGATSYTVNNTTKTASIVGVYAPAGYYIFYFDSSNSTYNVLGRSTGIYTSGLALIDVPSNIPTGSYANTGLPVQVSCYDVLRTRFAGIYHNSDPVVTGVFGTPTIGARDYYTKQYIVSFNAGAKTMTLSSNALFNSDGELYSGSTPPGSEKVTYTRNGLPGGAIYATETTQFFPGDIWIAIPGNSVSETLKKRVFIFTISGYLSPSSIGQTKQAVWEEVFDGEFKQTIVSSTDFSVVMPAGRFIRGWIAKSTAGLTLVTGTTNGATDIDSGTPLTANVSEAIGYSKKYDVDTTIYFTGITGNGATVTVNFY